MKKLKPDLDELEVESFATTPGEVVKGTVHGYETAIPRVCYGQYTVDYPLSCDGACNSYKCTDEISCAYTGCGDCTNDHTCEGVYTCAMSQDATCYSCAETC